MPLPVDLPWTKSKIRLCRKCRRTHYEQYPESIPPEYKGKRLRCKDITRRLHLRRDEVLQLKRYGCGSAATTTYCAEEALSMSRSIYGGDVGIASVEQSIQDFLDISSSRVSVYRIRLAIMSAGGTWRRIAP
ncbi:hypothetical protein BGZ76_009670 [Entomortierella beljakovae]|nr:hypothetical protein BGZ76_009670 [Entomortierella beljakovae]